jgi:hypothetical protein
MSTAEINAYLDWRAEREGKTVDVSPEAYERHQIIVAIFGLIDNYELYTDEPQIIPIGEMKSLTAEYRNLEEN